LQRVARLRTDGSLAVVLAWLHGAPLKPFVGSCWPHLKGVGPLGAGKSTTFEALHNLFGFKQYGWAQLMSAYRLKKALSMSHVPVIFDEAGLAITETTKNAIYGTLNEAYGSCPSTHGCDGLEFNVTTPALLLGRDLWLDDAAVSDKFVIVQFPAEARDKAALAALAGAKPFPYGAWLEFLANWVAANDCIALLAQAEVELRAGLGTIAQRDDAGEQRTIGNYARLLVAERALRDWGVDLDIAAKVLELVTAHLKDSKGTDGERVSVARRLLQDILAALHTARGRQEIPSEFDAEGLRFHWDGALNFLRKEDKTYEIRDPRALSRLFTNEFKQPAPEPGASRKRIRVKTPSGFADAKFLSWADLEPFGFYPSDQNAAPNEAPAPQSSEENLTGKAVAFKVV
jgi:hypothetical protein